MFNARIETVDAGQCFQGNLPVDTTPDPADGFYDWTRGEDGGKDPWHIHLPEHQPFSLAGLWAYNKALDITSCTIITASAEPVSRIHDRMSAILDQSAYETHG